ncbi:hypothetical protein BgiBS90_033120 [Biomphalaria glabrata]|nr:hypothetical protein BgiBS90_033120 [Biomphalaria glabrata]
MCSQLEVAEAIVSGFAKRHFAVLNADVLAKRGPPRAVSHDWRVDLFHYRVASSVTQNSANGRDNKIRREPKTLVQNRLANCTCNEETLDGGGNSCDVKSEGGCDPAIE